MRHDSKKVQHSIDLCIIKCLIYLAREVGSQLNITQVLISSTFEFDFCSVKQCGPKARDKGTPGIGDIIETVLALAKETIPSNVNFLSPKSKTKLTL